MASNLLIHYSGASENNQLDPQDVKIYEGKIYCVVGPSNSGKTRLMRQLAGIDLAADSELTILGDDPRQFNDVEYQLQRLKIGYVTAENNLVSNLTLMQNITLAPLYHRIDSRSNIEKRAIRLCRSIGIESSLSQLPSTYSDHELTLADIVRNLTTHPKVLFVEDAFGAGDIFSQKSLLAIYQELVSKEPITLVLSTLHLPIAAECTEDFIFVSTNSLLSMGSWDEFIQNTNPDVKNYRSHFDMRRSLI